MKKSGFRPDCSVVSLDGRIDGENRSYLLQALREKVVIVLVVAVFRDRNVDLVGHRYMLVVQDSTNTVSM